MFSNVVNDYKDLTDELFDDVNFPKHEILETTIHKNIGIVANNSVMLHEGDIITANIYPFEHFNAVIEWVDEYKAYMLVYKKKKQFTTIRGIFDNLKRELQYLQNANIDIIGNIVDTPDLI